MSGLNSQLMLEFRKRILVVLKAFFLNFNLSYAVKPSTCKIMWVNNIYIKLVVQVKKIHFWHNIKADTMLCTLQITVIGQKQYNPSGFFPIPFAFSPVFVQTPICIKQFQTVHTLKTKGIGGEAQNGYLYRTSFVNINK
jgi:hypothetical protein